MKEVIVEKENFINDIERKLYSLIRIPVEWLSSVNILPKNQDPRFLNVMKVLDMRRNFLDNRQAHYSKAIGAGIVEKTVVL